MSFCNDRWPKSQHRPNQEPLLLLVSSLCIDHGPSFTNLIRSGLHLSPMSALLFCRTREFQTPSFALVLLRLRCTDGAWFLRLCKIQEQTSKMISVTIILQLGQQGKQA
ncbi:hypothetical protein MRB53_012571 [Persea americana]|uniref:Uncharacterized protein n=1 Tax=Persea americana TaxID=3435 RepID=A0ACC2LXY7_PERAE|nr:hypothetical protein MRB53_012571 [Persea americana]